MIFAAFARKTGQFIFALVMMLTVLGPGQAANNEAVGAALAKLMAEGAKVDTGSATANSSYNDIRAFYATRSFKPVWSRDSGPKGKAKALLGEIKTSIVHGLSPKLYSVDEMDTLMASKEPAKLARLDLLMTGALVDFTHDLINGRMTNLTTYPGNQIAPILLDPAKLVEDAAAAGNLRQMLGKLVGKDRRYLRLISKKLELQRIIQSGRWPKPNGRPNAAEARQMLALMGDLPVQHMNSSKGFDAELTKAVKSFQSRNGLETDGKLGPKTRAAMLTPLEEQARKIDINLERRRWQNRSTNGTMIYLNLVDQTLKMLVDDKTKGEAKIQPDASLEKLPAFYGEVISFKKMAGDNGTALQLNFQYKSNGSSQMTSGELVIEDQGGSYSGSLGNVMSKGDLDKLRLANRDAVLMLNEPIALYVTYLTSWATRDGTVHFRPDVYGRDSKLKAALGL